MLGKAAQFNATNGPRARREARWIAAASTIQIAVASVSAIDVDEAPPSCG